MGLYLANLAKVKRQSNGWITARCPICAAAGQDSNGNHLFVLQKRRSLKIPAVGNCRYWRCDSANPAR